ncbi:MAG: peptidoglycan editing factor PgeF [Candidatus Omnitrophica bacterium]|nr:peptidoglycan editing factor PgeF [Candidatus Omnitrophota bacterium]
MTECKVLKRPFLVKNNFGYVITDFKRKGMLCFFSNRNSNYNVCSSKNKKAIDSREKIFKIFRIKRAQAVFLKQIHGSKIAAITKARAGCGVFDKKSRIKTFDGAITDIADIALCVLTADCLPLVFFASRPKRVIGIVHAGWRGTQGEISKKIIRKICRRFCVAPEDITVFIGPGIRACCYEIKEDLKRPFPKHTYIRKGALYLDLAGANIEQMIDAGVKKGNIYDTQMCSFCRKDEFFSYRSGDTYKRMLTLVNLQA